MCHAAQEAGMPHHGYIDLTGRKKTSFSHFLVIPYPIGTKFAAELPASTSTVCIAEHSDNRWPDNGGITVNG